MSWESWQAGRLSSSTGWLDNLRRRQRTFGDFLSWATRSSAEPVGGFLGGFGKEVRRPARKRQCQGEKDLLVVDQGQVDHLSGWPRTERLRADYHLDMDGNKGCLRPRERYREGRGPL